MDESGDAPDLFLAEEDAASLPPLGRVGVLVVLEARPVLRKRNMQ